MEIKRFKDKNGREWFYGTGNPEEVDQLNEAKDFNTALDVLQSIRKKHNYLFGLCETSRVDRSIYGTRKDTGR